MIIMCDNDDDDDDGDANSQSDDMVLQQRIKDFMVQVLSLYKQARVRRRHGEQGITRKWSSSKYQFRFSFPDSLN